MTYVYFATICPIRPLLALLQITMSDASPRPPKISRLCAVGAPPPATSHQVQEDARADMEGIVRITGGTHESTVVALLQQSLRVQQESLQVQQQLAEGGC